MGYFFAIVSLLLIANRILFTRWICPSNLVTVAPAVIAAFLCLFGHQLQYNEIKSSAYFLVASALVAFWVGQTTALVFTTSIMNRVSAFSRFTVHIARHEKYMWIAAILSLLASAVLYYKAYRLHGVQIFGDDQIAQIVGRGILAHVRLMGYPALIIFSIKCLKTPKLKIAIIPGMLLASSFFLMVKYHVILPVLTTVLFVMIYRIKVNRLFLLILSASIFMLFIFNYLWFFYFKLGAVSVDQMKWTLLHLLDYIVGGFIVLGEKMQYLYSSSGDLNVYSLIFVSTPRVISELLGISKEYGIIGFERIRVEYVSNVGTMFYDIYSALGYLGMLFFVSMLGFLASWLFIYSLNSRNDCTKLLASHVLAILMLSSFFGNYFGLWAPWEYGFWIIVYTSIARLRLVSRERNTCDEQSQCALAFLGPARE